MTSDLIEDSRIEAFQRTVWEYYDAHGRHDLPWRQTDDPYKIMVSELMLQQTQVNRVIEKYHSFLKRFPDVQTLAAAPLGDVLTEWQGLGYNRRAKFLWQAAQQVASGRMSKMLQNFEARSTYAAEGSGQESAADFPDTLEALVALPGIGPNTAGAILAYAYNREVVFIETNIRTVFIHHFFHDQTDVPDTAVKILVEQTLPKNQNERGGGVIGQALPSPSNFVFRDWYWALMDYGTHIKQTHGNKSRASKSYVKQSKFEGSRRQIRGAVIRSLSKKPEGAGYIALQEQIGDERLDAVLQELVAEGMITRSTDKTEHYRLS